MKRQSGECHRWFSILWAAVLPNLFFMVTAANADWVSDANTRIEQLRKRDVQITVVNAGIPVQDLTVQIQQTKHQFAFGTCIKNSNLSNSNYTNFLRDHFEWGVCENETKWATNEPSRDYETYSEADNTYTWCAANGITMRGHTLFWEQLTYVQSWVQGLSYATYPTSSDLLTEVDERINSAVSHFQDKFVHWDVDNEMLPTGSDYGFYNRLGEAGRVHMFQLAHSVDPDCLLFMNEYSGNSFGSYDGNTYRNRANSLIGLGAPIGGLGIQGHINTSFNPQLYYDSVLEPLAQVGLPIWVTEFDVPATGSTAADELEKFYRICFSHASVEGIIMWGFWNDAWRWDGIANTDGTPNEAGVRYEDLMEEWTTSNSGFTGGNGDIHFRGFHGTYEITLSAPGQTTEVHMIQLQAGAGPAVFEIQTLLSSPPPDTTAPDPNPMTWASVPTATGPSSITMTATTATDARPPVEYYFECTSDASASSDWQTSPTYIAQGLFPLTSYTFRVRTRDSAPTPNLTDWSISESATTLPPGSDVEILGDWATGLTHTQEAGSKRALVFIAHEETTGGSATLASVTYGGQPMTKIIEQSAILSSGNYVAAFILNEAGISAATNSTFAPTWSGTTTTTTYASIFLSTVNQTAPVGDTDSANTTSSTPNPITTSALSTNDGDMVILGATCGNNGSYTVNNGFTEGPVQSVGTYGHTGVTGSKPATGANEIPSVTHTSPNRQALIGFVVQASPWLYGDFNDNEIVDIEDLSLFMEFWMMDDCILLDLNADCRINLFELAQISRNWLF